MDCIDAYCSTPGVPYKEIGEFKRAPQAHSFERVKLNSQPADLLESEQELLCRRGPIIHCHNDDATSHLDQALHRSPTSLHRYIGASEQEGTNQIKSFIEMAATSKDAYLAGLPALKTDLDTVLGRTQTLPELLRTTNTINGGFYRLTAMQDTLNAMKMDVQQLVHMQNTIRSKNA